MRLQGLIHVMKGVDVTWVVEVVDLQQPLYLQDPFLRQYRRVRLFIDGVVDILFQKGNNPVDGVIFFRGFLGGTGNDQRRSRLVDQDTIHLVDDGVVQLPLDKFVNVKLHVVPQIVKPKLVVGAVSDVRAVGIFPFLIRKFMGDHAYGKPKEFVDGPHPFRVTFGKVVIDGDHMDTLACQGVEADREGRHEGLSFTCLHFSDFPLVKNDPADELDIEMTFPQDPAGRFTHHGKDLRKDIVERFPVLHPLAVFGHFSLQPLVREGLNIRFQFVYTGHEGGDTFQLPLVFATHNL